MNKRVRILGIVALTALLLSLLGVAAVFAAPSDKANERAQLQSLSNSLKSPATEVVMIALIHPPLPEGVTRAEVVAEITAYGYLYTERGDPWYTYFDEALLDRDAVTAIVTSYYPTLDGIYWLDEGPPPDPQIACDRLDNKTAILRQWASDAATVDLLWDASSTTQKLDWTHTLIARTGLFYENFADLLVCVQLGRE